MGDQDSAGTGSGEADWFGPETSTFGDRLAGAREAAGMTRAQLARRVGVKESTLAKWEEDLAEPRANRLQTLAGVLGVSLGWLITAEGEGLDGPVGEMPLSDDLKALLFEMRQIKADVSRAGDRLGVLEKRLRRLMQEEQG